MPEIFTSPVVGQELIENYLDAVEAALVAASAPRADRHQVLQDIEGQIADMLARQPQPLTGDAVRNVIATLEPVAYFAEAYGASSAEPKAEINPARSVRSAVPYQPWLVAAGVGAGLVVMMTAVLLLAAAARGGGGGVVLAGTVLLLAIALTPLALHQGLRELRANPGRFRGRELVLATTTIYAAIAPLVVLALACALTRGYILFPIAIVAFLVEQFSLVRRMRGKLAATLPADPAPDAPRNGNGAGHTTRAANTFATSGSPAI